MLPRRSLAALAAGALIAAASPAARADFISAPDVVVYCDPTVAIPLATLGADFRARTGVPVRIFAAPALQQLALIARGARSDVVVLPRPQMDAAAGLIKAETRAGLWRTPVVLAARDAAASEAGVDRDTVAALLGSGRLAVIDPVAADRMDGPAALARLGWADTLSGRIDGLPSGQEVAATLASGTHPLGLLHRSDLAGHPNLHVVGIPPADAAPPLAYTAGLSKNILSRNATAFMAYLTGTEAAGRLGGLGLESAP